MYWNYSKRYFFLRSALLFWLYSNCFSRSFSRSVVRSASFRCLLRGKWSFVQLFELSVANMSKATYHDIKNVGGFRGRIRCSSFCVWGRNPIVWPFKRNLFSKTFTWYVFIYYVVLNLASVDKILWCDHKNEPPSWQYFLLGIILF